MEATTIHLAVTIRMITMSMVIATMATAVVIEETTIVIMTMDTTTVGAITTRTEEGTTKLCKSWNIALYCFQKKRKWTGIILLNIGYSLNQSYSAELSSIQFTIL